MGTGAGAPWECRQRRSTRQPGGEATKHVLRSSEVVHGNETAVPQKATQAGISMSRERQLRRPTVETKSDPTTGCRTGDTRSPCGDEGEATGS